MEGLMVLAGIVGVWFLMNRVILPRMGIQT